MKKTWLAYLRVHNKILNEKNYLKDAKINNMTMQFKEIFGKF
jgi:hypothetical protein